MTPTDGWAWETRRGDAGALHEPTPPPVSRRTVCEMSVAGPAVALGSSQPNDDIDPAAAEAAGLVVVRRRSGGGAVLLIPGDHLWIDVWLPRSDPLWLDDVSRAADWLADVWVESLVAIGVDDVVAHRGPLESGPWSGRVCFAGLGPGEVTAAGRKVVGVSQRRTRDWTRFQCLVHRRWDADGVFGLLSAEGAAAAAIEWRSAVLDVGDAPIRRAFESALASLT